MSLPQCTKEQDLPQAASPGERATSAVEADGIPTMSRMESVSKLWEETGKSALLCRPDVHLY